MTETVFSRWQIRGVASGDAPPADHLAREVAYAPDGFSVWFGTGTGSGAPATDSHLWFRSDGDRLWHDIIGAADLSTVFVGDGAGLTGLTASQISDATTPGRAALTGAAPPAAGDIGVTDNTITPGVLTYNTAAGSSGGPAGINRGLLIHYRRVAGGGGEVQVLVVESGTGPISGAMFTRSRVTGTWGAWRRYFRDSDVIGTVAQTGGLPTGALLETASNANGRYTRFADGTQICWRTMAAGSGAATTWTFPAAFVAAPAVTGTAVATVLSAVCLDAAPTTTDATFSARDKVDARRADTCHLRAEGRWF